MINELKGKKVIVRGYGSGVQYGTVEDVQINSGNYATVHLSNSRRIWYWDGAFTLNAVATNGVNRNSKLAIPVSSQYVYDCCEIIECSEEAIKCLDTQPTYQSR